MIHARIGKRFPPRSDSSGFILDLDLKAAAGVTVLFGPSGAGKTLTLDCIAGFVRPDEGRILVDDQILFDAQTQVSLPPRKRNCGYVFQNYALFPHMTLRQNLLFAVDRLPRLERHRKVSEMIERFHLSGVAGRRPHEVSGGEKQRCSIARALIGGPKLLLLDEPARGLDAPLRTELYAVIRQVRADFGLPVLLVTHDLDECFALGDEMLVLREGKVIQSGRPRQVFDHPATLDIARLLGIANIFPVEIAVLDPGRNTSLLRLEFGEMQGLYYPGRLRGDRVWMCIGPEQLRIAGRSNGSPEPNQIPLRLLRVSEKPEALRLEFEGGIVVETPREEFERQKDNQEWLVEFPPHALRIIG